VFCAALHSPVDASAAQSNVQEIIVVFKVHFAPASFFQDAQSATLE
jgi:hypothetical protein